VFAARFPGYIDDLNERSRAFRSLSDRYGLTEQIIKLASTLPGKIGSGVGFKHLDTFEIGEGVFIGAQSYLQGRFDGLCAIGARTWIGPQSYFDARNLIIDYYRSQARFQFITVEPLTAGETEPALRIPPEDVVSECEFREHLNAWLDCCTRELELEQQVAVLQSDVYDYRDKDSAEMLRMSVPSFKLLLHGARARLKEIGSSGRHTARPPSPSPGNVMATPPAQVRYRLGVNCHLATTELVALKRKLMEGLRIAAFYSLIFIDDFEVFELLDFLIEM